jgi:hypothetical protein
MYCFERIRDLASVAAGILECIRDLRKAKKTSLIGSRMARFCIIHNEGSSGDTHFENGTNKKTL